MTDLAIVGSGPAALGAAIYAARANLSVIIYERGVIGGTLPEISHLANYPGFDGSGADLAKALRHQVEGLGVKITYDEITDLSSISARAILVATGSEPIKLSFTPAPPVSYCALCDAPLYRDKRVLVIGGGNSAVGESLSLAKVVADLTLMTHSKLKAEPSRIDQLKSLPNVHIIEGVEPTPENTAGYDGIFVYIGKRPATTFLDPSLCDEAGYLKTSNSHQVKDNIFAAGDVRAGTTHQVITATADGVAAALEIISYLKEH